MPRRVFVLFLAAFGLMTSMAMAGPASDQIVKQLASQGYEKITISRTWLGRTRIVAEAPNRMREIVINPRTGEILRDFWESEDGENEGLLGDGQGSNDDEEDSGGEQDDDSGDSSDDGDDSEDGDDPDDGDDHDGDDHDGDDHDGDDHDGDDHDGGEDGGDDD